jgi:hypothetical protein
MRKGDTEIHSNFHPKFNEQAAFCFVLVFGLFMMFESIGTLAGRRSNLDYFCSFKSSAAPSRRVIGLRKQTFEQYLMIGLGIFNFLQKSNDKPGVSLCSPTDTSFHSEFQQLSERISQPARKKK